MAKSPMPSEQAFGFVFATAFALLFFVDLTEGRGVGITYISISLAFLALAIFRPAILTIPSRLWLTFGQFLQRFTQPAILALIFFGVITPTALLMRAFGKDALRLRRNTSVRSYWIEVPAEARNPEVQMTLQF